MVTRERRIGDVTLLDLRGRLVFDDGDEEVRTHVNRLVSISPRCRRVLTISRLLGVFQIFESEQDALASFADGRRPVTDTSEAARLAALLKDRILDTAPEPAFDDLTRLASHICGTPITLITLVDAERQ